MHGHCIRSGPRPYRNARISGRANRPLGRTALSDQDEEKAAHRILLIASYRRRSVHGEGQAHGAKKPYHVRFQFDNRTCMSILDPMERLSATALRQRLYTVLDEVLETGVPVEIERHGKTLRIVPGDPSSKLARLNPRAVLISAPDDIVHLDWSAEWTQAD